MSASPSEAPSAGLTVWALREIITPSLPALAAFADEDTPTAAEWQDLSDYADELADALNAPYALFPRMHTENRPADMWKIAGSIVHSAKYLRCNLMLRQPSEDAMWPEDPSPAHNTDVIVSINGAEYAHFRNGNVPLGGAARHYYEDAGGGNDHSWDELVDLSAAGLTEGELYEVEIAVSNEGGFGFAPARYAWLYLFGESTGGEAQADPAGWQALPEWEHGDYVRSSGAKVVSYLKADLEALGAIITEHGGTVCREPFVYGDWQYSGVRRWRWLLYKNARNYDPDAEDPDDVDTEMTAKIGYEYAGDTREISLDSTEGYAYGAFDMDSVEGLYPGMFYVATGVTWAVENVHA